MGLMIHHDRITEETAAHLQSICPFNAIDYQDGMLSINAACKSCRLCVKNGPTGAISWADEISKVKIDKNDWRGIVVFAERRGNGLHPVTLELLGKARELAGKINHPVFALLIGSNVEELAEELLHYGADQVYLYDHSAFDPYLVASYANAFYDFIEKVHPSSILVGATNLGRSLAPKVAARCNTGLTADCTVLEMKENTDLVQIRPAFGGNIMAQIVTPQARPQFCTVRYKIFSQPLRSEKTMGEIVRMSVSAEMIKCCSVVLEEKEKPKEVDISEADIIVACGRGVKGEEMFEKIAELADALGARLASTRPLVEEGRMNPKQQIGLSGRTVKPKMILTLGISGSVQFVAGMKGADWIVAINNDPNAAIFDVAHVGIVGDLNEIVPALLDRIHGGKEHV